MIDSDDPEKSGATRAVDWASSKTPLDQDDHIDPAQARASIEESRKAMQTTSKSRGGTAPVEAKANSGGKKDDREKEPIAEETRDLHAQEQVKNKLR